MIRSSIYMYIFSAAHYSATVLNAFLKVSFWKCRGSIQTPFLKSLGQLSQKGLKKDAVWTSFLTSLGPLSRKVLKNGSLLQSEKNGHRKSQKGYFLGVCFWGTFLQKKCKKGDPEPLLKQEHILLDSGRPRLKKKGFREVPDVSSTQ